MLFSLFILIGILVNQSRCETSTTSCTTDPKIYKFDIREYVNSLGDGSDIADINVSDVCDKAYMYDYIWIT